MILYKHIFYIISRWVKKYDGKLWDVGDTYFIYGGMFLALVIFTTVVCIVDWMGLLFFDGILKYVYSDQFTLFYKLFPLSVGVGTTFYLYKKNDGNIRNCDKIYKEIDILDRKKKRNLTALQIVHLSIVFALFISSGFLVRNHLAAQ